MHIDAISLSTHPYHLEIALTLQIGTFPFLLLILLFKGDFMDEFLPNEAAYIICNSVGGIAGLQMQIDDPSKVKGLMLINISLRMLHVSKQAPFARPFVKAFQTLLRETDIGNKFFANVARPQTVKSILQQVQCKGGDHICIFWKFSGNFLCFSELSLFSLLQTVTNHLDLSIIVGSRMK